MSDYLNLTQDLFEEILVRVPIQDLVKSTAVCKSWNSLIKNPIFISTHLEKTISFNNATNTHLLLFRLCDKADPSPYSFYSVENYSLRFDNEDVDEYKQLHLPSESASGCFRVAGSINGLVCLVEDNGRDVHNYILWNPIINKAVSVPTPSFMFSAPGGRLAFIGFGFDSKTNDYKLLRYVFNWSKGYMVEVEIYSLNANCWRSITHIAPKYGLSRKFPRTPGNIFVNGAIHMIANSRKDRNLILAFDVSEEVFTKIPLPECLSKGYQDLELLKYGQSIAVMTKQAHLWVMNESWFKVFTGVAESVSRVLFFRQDEEQAFVFIDLDGEPGRMKEGLIASVDIKDNHSKFLGIKSVEFLTKYPVVDGFVESLVLLDNGNAWDVNARTVYDSSSVQKKKKKKKMVMIQKKKNKKKKMKVL